MARLLPHIKMKKKIEKIKKKEEKKNERKSINENVKLIKEMRADIIQAFI